MQAMNVATAIAKRELREQTVRSGLGAKVANTWRDKVYPDRGARSAEPAGYIWSRAPEIVDAYTSGATIRPVGGQRFLWIPTKAVPRRRGARGRDSRMTPEEVEAEFNQDFIFRRVGAHVLAFIARERGTTKAGGLRKVRKGRRGDGETKELVLMFTLVSAVKVPKAIDLAGVPRPAVAPRGWTSPAPTWGRGAPACSWSGRRG